MEMYLYECEDGFYDDQDGMPVPCKKDFWASQDSFCTCPRCGNDSLKITQISHFEESKK